MGWDLAQWELYVSYLHLHTCLIFQRHTNKQSFKRKFHKFNKCTCAFCNLS